MCYKVSLIVFYYIFHCNLQSNTEDLVIRMMQHFGILIISVYQNDLCISIEQHACSNIVHERYKGGDYIFVLFNN